MILGRKSDIEYPERHSLRHFSKVQEIQDQTVQMVRPEVIRRTGGSHFKRLTVKRAIGILSAVLLVVILAVILT